MPRHPADRGPSSWSRHGDARQLLSLQHLHARASSHLLWSGSDTEEEEGRSIKYLIASTDATASCCSHASVWIHVVDSAATPFLPIRNQTNRPFGRTRKGALAHDIGFSRKLPLKSPDACHIFSLGFLFANYRPPQRAGGLARGAPGRGRGALVGKGACGRGGGEVQVAAALALVSACFSTS